jgi:hypothetical protein
LTQFYTAVLYNHFARTTQKTQPIYCWGGVFTAPLHSNGSYSIFACVFVAKGMCLPSRCLAMKVYSDFTIPAFERNVTISRGRGKSLQSYHPIKYLFAVFTLTDRHISIFDSVMRWSLDVNDNYSVIGCILPWVSRQSIVCASHGGELTVR